MNFFYLETMNFIKNISNLYVSQRATNLDLIFRRAALFNKEKIRQLKEIERIEKIEVKVIEPGKECILVMNKDISTPFNCALRKFYLNSIFKA